MAIKTLAIVDAGIGGLGTYRALKARAQFPVLYFSDSGYEPYGKLDTDVLRNRLQQVFDFLYTQGADKIAVACNAASCALPNDSNAEGIIRHGIDAIKASGLNNIGVIGGARTIHSQVYARPLRRAGFKLQQRIAQALSIRVEAGELDTPALHTDIKKIMHPLRHTEAVLLACTHYPAIEAQIKRYVSEQTQLIDPAELLADWIIQNWHFEASDAPDRWFTSGDPAKLIENGKRAFGVSIDKPQQINIAN